MINFQSEQQGAWERAALAVSFAHSNFAEVGGVGARWILKSIGSLSGYGALTRTVQRRVGSATAIHTGND